MVSAPDTSFLFALYGYDSHTTAATAWMREQSQPLKISSLNDFEFRNSLRFAESRRMIAPGASTNYLTFFENSIRVGRLILTNCNLSDVIAEAKVLSKRHTLRNSHRSFSILHVAAAKILEADHFLTFDPNQKQLAEAEGLMVPF